MARMTLREASERTSRSITTLRRYIRSGRLRAEKRDGRFGPEYFVSDEDLAGAGLEQDAAPPTNGMVPAQRNPRSLAPAPAPRPEGVPLILYQELQMKHEQLLVQYGMVRAGGMRAMELNDELEGLRRKLEERSAELDCVRRQQSAEARALKRDLRAAHLELEGRALQIAALEAKVRALEKLTRKPTSRDSIEKQYRSVIDQSRRVGKIRAGETWTSRNRQPGTPPAKKPSDH